MSYSTTMETAISDEIFERGRRTQSRPSLRQVKYVIEFMRKHPKLANTKLKQIMSNQKFKKLWIELANNANSITGAIKSNKAWIKYWIDKKRCVMLKDRQIQRGKTTSRISPLEQKILNICSGSKTSKKNKKLKHQPLLLDDQIKDVYSKNRNGFKMANKSWPTEADRRHMSMIEKMAEVMNKQATAMTQIAEACHTRSNSMGRLADASYQQALAVDRLSNSFQSVGASIFEVRDAVVSIDHVMKRYLLNSTQHRLQSNLFT